MDASASAVVAVTAACQMRLAIVSSSNCRFDAGASASLRRLLLLRAQLVSFTRGSKSLAAAAAVAVTDAAHAAARPCSVLALLLLLLMSATTAAAATAATAEQ